MKTRYQQLLGCNNVNLTNTTNFYARYTTSVICNSIVQNSIKPCSLSSSQSSPLCAESCVSICPSTKTRFTHRYQAQQATSEEGIAVNSQLCGSPRQNFVGQIRADFTNCALPSDSLSSGCITGEENEPNDCGFSTNLQGLCGYCATSSPNATDSCCVGANVTSRCPGVTLPSTTSLPPFLPSSTSNSTASPSSGASHSSGLSGGQIAGIVVGSLLGALLLIALLLFCCMCLRRRRRGSQASIFNQPTPQRKSGSPMTFAPPPARQSLPPDYGPQAGGRVARMSALEGSSSDSPSYGATAVAAGIGGHRRYGDTSESEAFNDTTPESRPRQVQVAAGKRNGSLSSQSALGALDDYSSPNTEGQISSPEGVASGQSEQLPFFKDYYSQDEIHPNDRVSVLWAYQPRAGDEFELERGDMLKVVGIWDDGWATGVRINERADEYDPKRKVHRDSGVSNSSGRRGDSPPSGELKAFPVSRLCLYHRCDANRSDSSSVSAFRNTGNRPSKRTLGRTMGRVDHHKGQVPDLASSKFMLVHMTTRFGNCSCYWHRRWGDFQLSSAATTPNISIGGVFLQIHHSHSTIPTYDMYDREQHLIIDMAGSGFFYIGLYLLKEGA